MKKKVKFIGLFVFLVAISCLLSTQANALTYGDFEYELLKDGTVEIVAYNGSATKLTIPSKIKGKKVTSLGNCSFYRCELESISIPDSITSIGDLVFFESKVKNVELGKSIKTIGSRVFYECDELTNVTIPDSVTVLGKGAFENCDNLKTVVLSNKLKAINDSTFFACKSLKKISIPDSVISIGENAFYQCTSVKSIMFGDGLQTIGDGAFYECGNPKTIELPQNLASIGKGAFYGCGLKSVVIGTSVKSIGKDVFSGLLRIYYMGTKEQWDEIEGIEDALYIDVIGVYYEHSHSFTEYKLNDNATYAADGTKTAVCDNGCKIKRTVAVEGSKLILGKTSKITATQNASSITLKWNKVTDATGYRVYQKIDGKWKALKTTTSRSYTVKNLKSGTEYSFAVKAYTKVDGKTVWAAKYTSINTATDPAVTKEITASQTTSSITLKWSKVTGATGYRVYKYNSETEKYEKIKTTTSRSYKVTGLKPGTTYKFKVKAYKKIDGKTLWGSSTSAFTTATRPKVTSKISVSRTANTITLSWKKVTGATGYRVYQSVNGKWKALKTTTSRSYTVKKLKAGTEYKFAVKAYKTVNDSRIWASSYKSVTAKTLSKNAVGTTSGGIELFPVTSNTAKKIQANWKSCILYDSYEGRSADGKTIVVYINGSNEWSGRDISGNRYDTYGKFIYCEYCGLQMGEKNNMCDGDCAVTFH